jgi:hypothetical protein
MSNGPDIARAVRQQQTEFSRNLERILRQLEQATAAIQQECERDRLILAELERLACRHK